MLLNYIFDIVWEGILNHNSNYRAPYPPILRAVKFLASNGAFQKSSLARSGDVARIPGLRLG